MLSKLHIQCSTGGLGYPLPSPASSDDALDAAVIAAISSTLPNLVALEFDGAQPVEVHVTAEAEKVFSDGDSESGVSLDTDISGQYSGFLRGTSAFGSDRAEMVRALQEQLDDLRRQNEDLIDQKLLVLRGRQKQEEERYGWINILKGRMDETLSAKDELNKAKEEVNAQRQEQQLAVMRDMQKKVASALRQRDEALTDNISNEEQRLREADRYKGEVERLQIEIEEQLTSGDGGNIGAHLNDLNSEHRRRVNRLQSELTTAQEKFERDEKKFVSRIGTLEEKIRTVDIEKTRLQTTLATAMRNFHTAERDRGMISRQLEMEQHGRKREKGDLSRAQEELSILKQERADAMREADENKRGALEAEHLRREVEESSERIRQIESDAKDDRQRLQEDVRHAKDAVRELIAENAAKVPQSVFNRLQEDLKSLMARTADTKQKHRLAIVALSKQHESTTKRIAAQLAEARREKESIQAKANEDLCSLVLERDRIRKTLENERQQIAELEVELTDVADRLERYRNNVRMRMERERLDKLRQIAKLRQDLDSMARTYGQAKQGLQSDIQILKKEIGTISDRAKERVGLLVKENQQLEQAKNSLQRSLESMDKDLALRKHECEGEARRVAFSEAELRRKAIELETVQTVLREERENHAAAAASMRKELETVNLEALKHEQNALLKAEMENNLARLMEAEQLKNRSLESIIDKMTLESTAEGGMAHLRDQLEMERNRAENLEQQLRDISKAPAAEVTLAEGAKMKATLASKVKAAATQSRIQELERKLDKLQRVEDPAKLAATAPPREYLKELERQLDELQGKHLQTKKREEQASKDAVQARTDLTCCREELEALKSELKSRDLFQIPEVQPSSPKSPKKLDRSLQPTQPDASPLRGSKSTDISASPKKESKPKDVTTSQKKDSKPKDNNVTLKKGLVSTDSNAPRKKAVKPMQIVTSPNKDTMSEGSGGATSKKGFKGSTHSRSSSSTPSSKVSPKKLSHERGASTPLSKASSMGSTRGKADSPSTQKADVAGKTAALPQVLASDIVPTESRQTDSPSPAPCEATQRDVKQEEDEEGAASIIEDPEITRLKLANDELAGKIDRLKESVRLEKSQTIRALEELRLVRESVSDEKLQHSKDRWSLKETEEIRDAFAQKAKFFQAENLRLTRALAEAERKTAELVKLHSSDAVLKRRKDLESRENRLSGLSDERKVLAKKVVELTEKIRLLSESERQTRGMTAAKTEELRIAVSEKTKMGDLRNLKDLKTVPMKSPRSPQPVDVSVLAPGHKQNLYNYRHATVWTTSAETTNGATNRHYPSSISQNEDFIRKTSQLANRPLRDVSKESVPIVRWVHVGPAAPNS